MDNKTASFEVVEFGSIRLSTVLPAPIEVRSEDENAEVRLFDETTAQTRILTSLPLSFFPL